jgi:tRNA modification GTPase
MGGFPFRLVDTAGIRDGAEEVERMGIEVARRYLGGADVVLLCLPVDQAWSGAEDGFLAEWSGRVPVVLVRSCADREAVDGGVREPAGRAPGDSGSADGVAGTVSASARTGQGLGELRELIGRLVFSGLVKVGVEAPLLTRRRQREGVARAEAEVRAFGDALAAGVPPEAAVSHLRTAEAALEELLGVISPEEVLDQVFARFCIGK